MADLKLQKCAVLLVLTVLQLSMDSSAHPVKDTDRLFAVRVNGKYGYVDTKGTMVIKPQFESALKFQEGLAGVTMGGQKRLGRNGYVFYLGGKFGYIDTTGKFVVPLGVYASGQGFSEGLAEVNLNGCKGDICAGYIDKSGKLVIKPRFSSGSEFREGLAVVKLSTGKLGVIDRAGKFVVPAIYDGILSISEGIIVANIQLSGDGNFFDNKLPRFKSVLLDKDGDVIARPEHTVFGHFSEGLTMGSIAVTVNSQDYSVEGVVDKTGKFVIEPKYQKVGDFVGGLAPARIRNKSGFIDRTGEFVIEPVYDWAESFRAGLAKVSVDRKTGFIDRTGKMVIEPRSWTVEEFVDGHAFVTEDGFTGYIDKTGRYLWKKRFE